MSPIFSSNFSRSNVKVKVQNPSNALFGTRNKLHLIRNSIFLGEIQSISEFCTQIFSIFQIKV